MDTMKHEIDDRVRMIESDEVGTVIGRAEYKSSEPSYYVRYRDARGVQVLVWWGESSVRAESDVTTAQSDR